MAPPPLGDGGTVRRVGFPVAPALAEAEAEAPGEAGTPDAVGDGDIPFFPAGRAPAGKNRPVLDPSATLPTLAGVRLGAFGPGSLPALTQAATPVATRATSMAERTPAVRIRAVRELRLLSPFCGAGMCGDLGRLGGGCLRGAYAAGLALSNAAATRQDTPKPVVAPAYG
ncbi:hypothetical protein [Streptomyces sp. NBC_01190]|uniref:hypothetical protein n=1 Tax=Streptomyces sp. NBC_01190 TaxID=2903767 RepID=UPI003869D1CB|nr:hypothetical protein OG519_14260 [Streptomyces sp. NBC_01190]